MIVVANSGQPEYYGIEYIWPRIRKSVTTNDGEAFKLCAHSTALKFIRFNDRTHHAQSSTRCICTHLHTIIIAFVWKTIPVDVANTIVFDGPLTIWLQGIKQFFARIQMNNEMPEIMTE